MEISLPTTAGQLAEGLNAQLIGDPKLPIAGVGPLESCCEGLISLWTGKTGKGLVSNLQGGALLTPRGISHPNGRLTYLEVEDPKLGFSKLLGLLAKRMGWPEGVSPQAWVHPSAHIGPRVAIGPFAVIAADASLGEGTTVFPFTYVGERVTVGRNCVLHPHVTLLDGVVLGDRVKVFSGSVLGSDGFGFLPSREEIPQVGGVRIGDDVRIGALCTVDRATVGDTAIGSLTKMDDHVHIGHNTIVGERVLLCGATAVAGSCRIEDDVVCGGQVGISDHVEVGKGAELGAQSGVFYRLKGGRRYWSTPAVPVEEALQIQKELRRKRRRSAD